MSADVGPLARNQRGRGLRGLVARGAHDPEHDAIDPLLRAHRSAHPRADLGMLRHTVEDTVYTLDQARAEFGDEVAHLVDGVTKLDKLRLGDAAEAETIRKLTWRWPGTCACW